MDEPSEDSETAGIAEETETTRAVLLPGPGIYVENAIDYKLRNLILERFGKYFEEYNLAAPDGEKISGWEQVYDLQAADIVFKSTTYSYNDKNNLLDEPFYFAIAASFFSLIEDITWEEFMDFWNGRTTGLHDIEGNTREV